MWFLRQAQIIELLLLNPSGLSGTIIGEKINVSARTIRNDINFLNEDLSPYNCSIKSAPKRGYYIKHEDINLIKALLDNFKQNQKTDNSFYRKLSLIGILIFDGLSSLEDIADLLFVSPQTIYKDLISLQKDIKKKLCENFLKINSNSVILNHKEELIRKFFLLLIKEEVIECSICIQSKIINVVKKFYDEAEFIKLIDLIKKLFEEKNIILSDELLFLISWSVYFSILRTRSNHLIENRSYDNKSDEKIKDVMRVISKSVENFSEADINFLDHFMWTLKLYDNSSNENNSHNEYSKLINEFCSEVYLKYGFNLRNQTENMKNLSTHIEYMIRRLETGYVFDSPIKNQIKENFTLAYEIAMLIVPIVYKYHKKYLLDGEVSFIAVYIELHMKDMHKNTKVIIVTRYDSAIVKITKNWLLTNFPNQMEILDIIPEHLLLNYLKVNDVDLIISISTMIQIDFPMVYVIEEMPHNSDRMKILEVLNQIHIGIRCRTAICHKFSKNLFHIFNEDNLTFEEVINYMAKSLYDGGSIKNVDVFVKDLLQREENYPTLLSDSFLIPHPIGVFAEKTSICAAILKKGVKCHNKDIKIIFILALEAMFDAEVNDLFQLFKRIATHKVGFEKLLESKNYEEFFNTLDKISSFHSFIF